MLFAQSVTRLCWQGPRHFQAVRFQGGARPLPRPLTGPDCLIAVATFQSEAECADWMNSVSTLGKDKWHKHFLRQRRRNCGRYGSSTVAIIRPAAARLTQLWRTTRPTTTTPAWAATFQTTPWTTWTRKANFCRRRTLRLRRWTWRICEQLGLCGESRSAGACGRLELVNKKP